MGVSDWNPEKVTKSHVRKAAQIWRRDGGYLNFRNSVSYDVMVDGKLYPPKAISSIAHKLATGKGLAANEFGGVRDGIWHRRLKELGFPILEKGGDAALEYDVSKSLALTSAERAALIANEATQPPKKIEVRITRFGRSPYVVAERLTIAKGKCEKCKKPAPFLRAIDRTPYLEVHHVVTLANGGHDTVENTQALCPNCHSEIHDLDRIERQVE